MWIVVVGCCYGVVVYYVVDDDYCVGVGQLQSGVEIDWIVGFVGVDEDEVEWWFVLCDQCCG